MKAIDKVVWKLRGMTSDKESLNRHVLHLHKCFKEVEKILNRKKK